MIRKPFVSKIVCGLFLSFALVGSVLGMVSGKQNQDIKSVSADASTNAQDWLWEENNGGYHYYLDRSNMTAVQYYYLKPEPLENSPDSQIAILSDSGYVDQYSLQITFAVTTSGTVDSFESSTQTGDTQVLNFTVSSNDVLVSNGSYSFSSLSCTDCGSAPHTIDNLVLGAEYVLDERSSGSQDPLYEELTWTYSTDLQKHVKVIDEDVKYYYAEPDSNSSYFNEEDGLYLDCEIWMYDNGSEYQEDYENVIFEYPYATYAYNDGDFYYFDNVTCDICDGETHENFAVSMNSIQFNYDPNEEQKYGYFYNGEDAIVFYIDNDNYYDITINEITFYDFGEDSLYNAIYLSVDVIFDGDYIRHGETLGVVVAKVEQYPDESNQQYGAIAGEFHGDYIEYLSTGYTEIDHVVIKNGYNYLSFLEEIIYFDNTTGRSIDLVYTDVIYGPNTETLVVKYTLDGVVKEPFTLTSASWTYDSELKDYNLTGYCSLDLYEHSNSYYGQVTISSKVFRTAEHDGIWYDASKNALRFYDITRDEEPTVELEAVVIDCPLNTDYTSAEIRPHFYYKDGSWMDYESYTLKPFSLTMENGYYFISGTLELDKDGPKQVKLKVDTLNKTVIKKGINYIQGYNEFKYFDSNNDVSVVDISRCEFNEITRKFTLTIYYNYFGTGKDEDFIYLTNGVVLTDDLDVGMQDTPLCIEGYWEELGKRIRLYVRVIEYNSLEEEAISTETIDNIYTALGDLEIDTATKDDIKDQIEASKNQISESTGDKIYQALDNTVSDISDDAAVAEKQKDVIVLAVKQAINLVTRKPTDVGRSIATDNALPDDAGLKLEDDVKEFYDIQLAELIGGQSVTRTIKRADNDSGVYKIDVANKSVDELNKDLKDFEQMLNFIGNSVDHMNTAGLKIRKCSGESMKVEVGKIVKVIKTSSFRDFDKDAADLQFAYDVHDAMMLHLQEVVVKELEKGYKQTGNKQKDQQYKEELEACKDIESFTEIVIEVLRQKYNAIKNENIKQGEFGQKGSGKYWDIFKAWCLDDEEEQSKNGVTFQQLTDSTIETTTRNARGFEFSKKATSTDLIFAGAFAGGAIAFVTLTGVVGGLILKKKRRGLVE